MTQTFNFNVIVDYIKVLYVILRIYTAGLYLACIKIKKYVLLLDIISTVYIPYGHSRC